MLVLLAMGLLLQLVWCRLVMGPVLGHFCRLQTNLFLVVVEVVLTLETVGTVAPVVVVVVAGTRQAAGGAEG